MLKKLSFYTHLPEFAALAAGLASVAAFLAIPTDSRRRGELVRILGLRPQARCRGTAQAAFARLRGENGSLLWLTCQRQVLDSDQPPVSFITAAVAQKQYLGRSDPRGRSTVYWFDGGSPEVGHWVYRDRYGQIPEPEQVHAFVDKLAQAQSLTVELSNYRYETQKLEFRLNAGDTKNVADRFRKDCRDILREEARDRSLSRA